MDRTQLFPLRWVSLPPSRPHDAHAVSFPRSRRRTRSTSVVSSARPRRRDGAPGGHRPAAPSQGTEGSVGREGKGGRRGCLEKRERNGPTKQKVGWTSTQRWIDASDGSRRETRRGCEDTNTHEREKERPPAENRARRTVGRNPRQPHAVQATPKPRDAIDARHEDPEGSGHDAEVNNPRTRVWTKTRGRKADRGTGYVTAGTRKAETQEEKVGTEPELILHGRQVPGLLYYHYSFLSLTNGRGVQFVLGSAVPAHRRACTPDGRLFLQEEGRLICRDVAALVWPCDVKKKSRSTRTTKTDQERRPPFFPSHVQTHTCTHVFRSSIVVPAFYKGTKDSGS